MCTFIYTKLIFCFSFFHFVFFLNALSIRLNALNKCVLSLGHVVSYSFSLLYGAQTIYFDFFSLFSCFLFSNAKQFRGTISLGLLCLETLKLWKMSTWDNCILDQRLIFMYWSRLFSFTILAKYGFYTDKQNHTNKFFYMSFRDSTNNTKK